MERTRHRLKRSAEPAGGRRRAGSNRDSIAGTVAKLPRERQNSKPKKSPFCVRNFGNQSKILIYLKFEMVWKIAVIIK